MVLCLGGPTRYCNQPIERHNLADRAQNLMDCALKEIPFERHSLSSMHGSWSQGQHCRDQRGRQVHSFGSDSDGNSGCRLILFWKASVPSEMQLDCRWRWRTLDRVRIFDSETLSGREGDKHNPLQYLVQLSMGVSGCNIFQSNVESSPQWATLLSSWKKLFHWALTWRLWEDLNYSANCSLCIFLLTPRHPTRNNVLALVDYQQKLWQQEKVFHQYLSSFPPKSPLSFCIFQWQADQRSRERLWVRSIEKRALRHLQENFGH